MISSNQSSSGHLAIPRPLAVAVRAEEEGTALTREPVTAADLGEAMGEAWLDRCLRQGYWDQALGEVPMEVVPLFLDDKGGSRLRGYGLEVQLPNGRVQRQEFSVFSLSPVANRAADRLMTAGLLAANHHFFYEIVLEDNRDARPKPADAGSFTLSVHSPPPVCVRAPLRTLLGEARAVQMLDDAVFPVFFTEEALVKAEAYSRSGGGVVPPQESGCVFVGSLAVCEITREFYVIVTEAIEANDAEQTTFSLAYSGQSWNRIQAILRAKQAAHSERGLRLVGQAHGHNFLPNEGKTCEPCPKRPVCTLTSVFVSRDDQTWMRAVFNRQPWALCMIHGLSARGDKVHQLYSLRDGRWQPRGYFVLPDFRWSYAEQKNQTQK